MFPSNLGFKTHGMLSEKRLTWVVFERSVKCSLYLPLSYLIVQQQRGLTKGLIREISNLNEHCMLGEIQLGKGACITKQRESSDHPKAFDCSELASVALSQTGAVFLLWRSAHW